MEQENRIPASMLKKDIKGLPEWITGYIGHCPFCGKGDMLLFVLRDNEGQYLHCMICNNDFRENMEA